jgi:hypothetical protein
MRIYKNCLPISGLCYRSHISLPVLWIRIRIGSGFNGVPVSGSRRAKMTHKNRKKKLKLFFLSAGCSLLWAEGIPCSLDVLWRHWPAISRGGREYTHSIPTGKLEARKFFVSYFKGPSSQDQQKTLRRRLITFKLTLTGQSHFMLICVLRKVTLRSHINSVPWMYAVTPTPYNECTEFSKGFFGPIAYIHGTELVWPRKVTLRSWCDRVHSRYGVDSIPQSHSKWFLCTLYTVQCTVALIWRILCFFCTQHRVQC